MEIRKTEKEDHGPPSFSYVANRYFSVRDLTPLCLFSYRFKMKELNCDIFKLIFSSNVLWLFATFVKWCSAIARALPSCFLSIWWITFHVKSHFYVLSFNYFSLCRWAAQSYMVYRDPFLKILLFFFFLNSWKNPENMPLAKNDYVYAMFSLLCAHGKCQ